VSGSCSKCAGVNDRSPQRYCRSCHAAAMRVWRERSPLRGEAAKRDAARSYTHAYVKSGWLVQEPCAACGSQESEIHHPDYDMPLDIVWFCREHHLAWHNHEREAPSASLEDWISSTSVSYETNISPKERGSWTRRRLSERRPDGVRGANSSLSALQRNGSKTGCAGSVRISITVSEETFQALKANAIANHHGLSGEAAEAIERDLARAAALQAGRAS
jgi:hypothetical protein